MLLHSVQASAVRVLGVFVVYDCLKEVSSLESLLLALADSSSPQHTP